MSKKDIEAAEQQWLNAFNGGDAAGVAQQYEEQARLMPPNLDILEGRGAIEAFCKEFVATGAQVAFRLLTGEDPLASRLESARADNGG